MKNKSSTYIWPSVYYAMKEEGLSGKIIHFVDETCMYSKSGLFTIILSDYGKFLDDKMDDELIDNISSNPYTSKFKKLNKGYLLQIKESPSISELIKVVASGKYSEIPKQHIINILDFQYKFSGLEEWIRTGNILHKNKSAKLELLNKYAISEEEISEDIELESIINVKDETYGAEEENKSPNTEV